MAVEERTGIGAIDVPERLKQSVSILAVVAIWAVGANLLEQLPSPGDVIGSFALLVSNPSFWGSVVQSIGRVYVAFVVALVLAVPLGLLIGWNQVFADITFPALEMLRPVPPIAWIPVTALALPVVPLGIGAFQYPVETGIVFITFLGAFFPILLNTIEGVQGIDEEYPRAAQSLGAAPYQTFRHIVFPGALPSIYTGAISGMGLAWVNLIAAEMIGGSGLGYLTWSSYIGGSYPTIIVGMISIGLLGYASSQAIRRLGERVLPWTEAAAV